MKHFILYVLISFSISQLITAQSNQNYLLGVEGKINTAFAESFKQNNVSSLLKVIDDISLINDQGNTHWKEYWMAYALYKRSMFNAYCKTPNEEKGKADVEEAINMLKGVNNKNAEDYALLGMMKGFSLQWKSFIAMAKQSSIATKWAKAAVELDDQNPRAQYVFGNNDFHTPSIFGGGKKADKSLTRAIALFKESIPNPLMPSWGMDEAYYMLVRTKNKADDNEGAATVLANALDLFPDNRRLQSLKK
ncbi:MAG: hypothetical protein V3V00_13970 [Saprospiraceae bacterium]